MRDVYLPRHLSDKLQAIVDMGFFIGDKDGVARIIDPASGEIVASADLTDDMVVCAQQLLNEYESRAVN